MITPNLSIKLVIIYSLFFAFLSLTYLYGINKIVGLFLIYYAYVNLLSLKNKGNKRFKLGLLKINISIIAIIILILNYSLYQHTNSVKSDEIELGIVLLLLIPLLINWIAIRNYKL